VNKIVVRRLHPDDAGEIGRISYSITGTHNQTDFQGGIGKQNQSEEDASFVATCFPGVSALKRAPGSP
jgi:hypothetical protein